MENSTIAIKKHKRVLLKISGEGFCSEKSSVIDNSRCNLMAREISSARKAGVEIAIIVGGGNIIRGAELSKSGVDRARADQLGMIATNINAIILQDSLKKLKIPTSVLSAIQIQNIVEPYTIQKCLSFLENGYIVIIAGGTGNPYFTTDTAAALRAIEIGADVFLKGTKVDGVYSDDPLTNPGAKKYIKLEYMDVLTKNLGVMDSTAISLSMENKLPIIVFNLMKKGNIKKAIVGNKIGTNIGNCK
ncbi:MAG: UMP kinase [Planctomycetes bacterium GWA2_40_7]|nr:MAG: UMP kinase [Planctomycetes bacterium GWA2_40_7]OHB89827.1 MAG: UMP kinase [Planctomycetes bacterium RIFCSPHIGHO2_02_FULL_40_12]OHC03270.1 MAG: UMP kinase [Planctomycetes bacterium RIFCSPLOWO2_12_FULL_40_19]